MSKIAFIASAYNETDEIKKQLQEKGITDIDVFSHETISDPLDSRYQLDNYEVVITDVRPNKTHGEILDLGQCINNHGFPEEPYNPPKQTGITSVDKAALDEATKHLRLEHLQATIDGDTPELITRKKYEQKIEEIKRNAKRLTNQSIRELSNKLEIENDPLVLISIAAVLFDKIHCEDMINDWGRQTRGYKANNGKIVQNFLNPDSISWIAEKWIEVIPNEEQYYQRKYIKSLRTRIKNMLKDKSSIWGLKFFIDYLLEKDEIEKRIAEEGSSTGSYEEEAVTANSLGYKIVIEEDEIPFSIVIAIPLIGLSQALEWCNFII